MQNKQRLELADYEAENLARLQKTFARKWEFVFMQAEAQAKSVSVINVTVINLSREICTYFRKFDRRQTKWISETKLVKYMKFITCCLVIAMDRRCLS